MRKKKKKISAGGKKARDSQRARRNGKNGTKEKPKVHKPSPTETVERAKENIKKKKGKRQQNFKKK